MTVKKKRGTKLQVFIRTCWTIIMPGVSAMLLLAIDNLFNLGVPIWLCIPMGGILYGLKKWIAPDAVL